MRRAPLVIGATVLGTAGVLLFKPLVTTSVVSASTTDGSTATSSGTTSSGTTSSGTASSSSTPSASASAGTGASSAKNGTYTGTAETTRFGTTQVKVTIAGGKITEVAIVQENQNDGRSIQISETAFPTLRSEVLTEQTAAVDTVSGATYTSAAYEASLQSALDQAGFTAADGSKASTDVSAYQGGGH